MIEYEYRNCNGETRSIRQRMSDRHPEAIAFHPDGSWFEVTLSGGDGPHPATVFERVYGNVQGNVVNGYPFASQSLPPGDYDKLAESAPDGSPIIKSKAHAREVAAASGRVYRSE